MNKIVIILVVLNVYKCIYFKLEKNSQKCIHEEFYSNTVVSLRYNVIEDLDRDTSDILHGEHEHIPLFKFILYKGDKEVDNYQGMNPSGRINLIIDESSSYTICVIPRSDSYLYSHISSIKISISIDTLHQSELDTSNIPKDEDFVKITNEVNTIQKRIVDIMRSQQYQIEKEDEYSIKQIDNTNIIVYMTLVQVVIVVILTIWQIVSFKNIFKN